MNSLLAVSPIDGRYRNRLKDLSEYFSEYALTRKRVYVELIYLIEIGKGNKSLLKIYKNFDLKECRKVKEIEKITNHDIKAVEYYLREKVDNKLKPFVHYGLTSEDINNLSYGLLIKDFIKTVYVPRINELLGVIKELALENKNVAMLARTHGQPASPTTLGKEFAVYYHRLFGEIDDIKKIKLTGKLNGATGNYNALYFAESKKDWIKFSEKFIRKLGLKPNLVTTQVEPRDSLIKLVQAVKRINNIILDLDGDLWIYIMLDYLKLKVNREEVGSSTMPHKVNPINFENSEGNIKIANSLADGLESLQVSRLQRDLSGSTVKRNVGVFFGHCVLAYESTIKGLKKVSPNSKVIKDDLMAHPEVLTEAVQIIARKGGDDEAYEKLKKFSRGEKITKPLIEKFVKKMSLGKREKKRLINISVSEYIGLAEELVKL